MAAVRYKNNDLTLHAWDSLYVSLIPLPAVLLGAALVSDVLYWASAAAICARASEWLLVAGLSTGRSRGLRG
jgi:uncharacterized membrane protein